MVNTALLPFIVYRPTIWNLQYIADAVKTVPYLQKFQDTIYQVFKFYHYSPKERRELRDVGDIIQDNTAHFGGVS